MKIPMICSRFSGTFVIILILCAGMGECKQNFAQETNDILVTGAVREKLSHEFSMSEKSPHHWFSEGSLGKLLCKETYELDFVLVNNTSRTIDLSRPKANCSCNAVQLENSTVVDRGTVRGKVRFTCPGNSSVNSSGLAIDFHNSDGAVTGRILINYELRRNLFVESPGLLKMSSSSVSEFKIPILLSEPLLPENLKVSGHENLSGLDLFCKVEADANGQVHLVLSAGSTKKTANSFTIVPLLLKDLEEGVELPLNLTFQAHSDLEIAPLNLTFRQSDSDSGSLEANVILKISELENGDQAPTISAKIGGTSLKLNTTRLSKKVYRIKLLASPRLLEDLDTDRIDWELRCGASVKLGQSFYLSNKGD